MTRDDEWLADLAEQDEAQFVATMAAAGVTIREMQAFAKEVRRVN